MRRKQLVTWGDWCVSYEQHDSLDGPCILHTFRTRIHGVSLKASKWPKGAGYGQTFPSVQAASQFALERGYLQEYFPSAALRASRKARLKDSFAKGFNKSKELA